MRDNTLREQYRNTDQGNADGAVGIFENAGRVWATALRPDPP